MAVHPYSIPECNIELINRVKQSPSLYDGSNEFFRNPKYKDAEWQKIGNDLNLTATKVRRRWTSLRERYSRELRKIRLHPEYKYLEEFEFFQHMQFLKPHVRERDSRIIVEKYSSTQKETVKECIESNSKGLLVTNYDIIDSVKQSPSLYDVNDINFRNKKYKYREWKKIGTALGLDAKNVHRRWTSLRERYVRELRNTGFSPSEDYYNENDFCHKMEFIKPFCNKRNTKYLKNMKSEFDDTEDDDTKDGSSGPFISNFKLIEYIKSSPIFYDFRNVNFRNQKRREEEWKKVASALGLEVGCLQRRWISLRERYVREMRSVDYNPDEEFYKENLFCQKMDFLKPFLRKRNRAANDLFESENDDEWDSASQESTKIAEDTIPSTKKCITEHKMPAAYVLLPTDREIIERVKSAPLLYNPTNVNFRNTVAKTREWEKAASELSIDVDILRRRWTTLRERYTRVLKSVNYKPDKTIFEQRELCRKMEFVRPFCRKRAHTSITDSSDSEDDNKWHESLSQDNNDNKKSTELFEIIGNTDDQDPFLEFDNTNKDTNLNETEFCEINAQDPFLEFSNTKRHIKVNETLNETEFCEINADTDDQDPFLEFSNTKKDIKLSEIRKENKVNDTNKKTLDETARKNNQRRLDSMEDDFFCKSVALYLSQLKRTHKIKAKVEIYQVLEKYIDLEENEK